MSVATPSRPGTSDERSNPDSSQSDPTDTREENENVDGGWAWVVVGASFYINFMAAGTFMCFGALYVEILDYFGETRSVTSLVASASGISMAMAGPVSTFTIPRFGKRVSVMIGTLMVTTGLIISGFAPNIYFLTFSYGVLVGGGCGLTWIVFVVATTVYFKKRRALAQGISFCGGGVSYLVFPFMYRSLVDSFAWQGTMWISAGIWMHAFIAGALLRPLHQKSSLRADHSKSGRSVLKKWSFYLFLFAHFLFYVDMLTFVNILPDSARLFGHSGFNAGLLLTILGAPIIPVRLLGNIIVDRGIISPTLYICIICIFLSLTAFIYPILDAYWYLALVSAIRGCAMAIIVPLSTVVCADVFGADRMTTAFGITVLADGASGLCGPALAGFTFDLTGSYTTMYMIMGTASLMSVVSFFVIHLYRQGRIGHKYPPTQLELDHVQAELRECDSLHVSREVVSLPLSRSQSALAVTMEKTILLNELRDSVE